MCQQRRAAAYCEEVKKSPGCLELCLTRFPTSPYIEVRFWCLQTLHEVRRAAHITQHGNMQPVQCSLPIQDTCAAAQVIRVIQII